ncbi:MAG: ATPase, T2SS/T4P/T4SS family [bacterium]
MAKGPVRRKSVKEILTDNKLLDEKQLKDAMLEAKNKEQPLQQVVINLNIVDKVELLRVLSMEWSVKAVDISEMEIDDGVAQIIPEQTARRHFAIAFAKEENMLFVAMSEPRDPFVSEDIQLRTGLSVQPYLALPEDITKTIDKAYGGNAGATLNKIMANMGKGIEEGDLQVDESAAEEKVDVSDVDVSAPEIEKIVNAIILGALNNKASDIHIEPYETFIQVRYRIDGVLKISDFSPPYNYRSALMAKIKIMTLQMDITERRKPQDGRIQLLSKGKPVEFRVNIIPTVFGESCVMRILDRSAVRVDMPKLGFLEDTLAKFMRSLKAPYGLILVCGPTGSGKSTTLYSALNAIKSPDVKIITAENPVEYNIDGIVQLNVNQDIGLDFSSALRAFLRQDPDIIMVGEIRDKETATIALEAAMTGHLVFSTVHTNDASSAVARLHEMGVPNFLISSTVECVLAQRLIRKNCPECTEPIKPTKDIIDYLKKFNVDTSNLNLHQGRGCSNCGDSGYKGRAGIHELLVMDDEMRGLLVHEISAKPINDKAIALGMRPMIMDGLIKVAMGMTTIEEILRVCQ